jgi:anaphase-promoting complex subunit 2
MIDELMERVALKDKPAALKALGTWVDLGVLRQDDQEGQYTLLERAETDVDRRRRAPNRAPAVADEPEPVVAAQQQQAEQMKMYWKVRFLFVRYWTS